MKFKYAAGFTFITTIVLASIAHATGPDCFGGEVQAIDSQIKTFVTEIKKSSDWQAPQVLCAVRAPGSTDQRTTESIRVFVDNHGMMEFESYDSTHDCSISTALQKKLDVDQAFGATVTAASYETWELDYNCQPKKKVGFACTLRLDSASPAKTFNGGMFDVKSREACEELGSKL